MKTKKKNFTVISMILSLLFSTLAIIIAYKSYLISEESFLFSKKKELVERTFFLNAEFESELIKINPVNKNFQIINGWVYLPSELSLSFYYNSSDSRIPDYLLKGNLLYHLKKELKVPIDSVYIGSIHVPIITYTNYIAKGEIFKDASLYLLNCNVFIHNLADTKIPTIIFKDLTFFQKLQNDLIKKEYIKLVDNYWEIKSDFKNKSDTSIILGNKSAELNYGNHFQKALIVAEESISQNKFNGSVWSNKAYAQHKLGKLSEALDSYNKAIANSPKLVVAWSNKSILLANMNRIEEALASVEHALRLDSSYSYAWNNLSYIQQLMNKNDQALVSAHIALSLDSNYVQNWYRIVECYVNLNLEDSAVAYLKKANLLDSLKMK